MATTMTVFVDTNFSTEERSVIGNSIISYIVARTKRGKGIDNKPFRNKAGATKYTDAYENHIDFHLGGKSSVPINLTLTGDMLSSIEILDIGLAGRIVIGIKDPQNADKAIWMDEKGYSFLGISEQEKNILLRQFQKLTLAEIQAANISNSIAQQFLEDLLDE